MPEGNDERLTIRLFIRGENIPVTIAREDEALYRAAATLINDRYHVYARKYTGQKGDHTIATMAMIDIAMMYLREHAKNFTTGDTLSRLTSDIEEALK